MSRVAALLCLSATVMVSLPAAAQEPLVPNLDLSQGLEGWSAWTGTTAHPWELDQEVGHGGKPSLRIDARSRTHQVMVMTGTDRLEPGQRYGFRVWWRMQDMSRDYHADLRVIYRDAEGGWLTGTDLYPYRTETEGEWTLRRYRTAAPERTASAAVGIWVRDTTGTIWVSDMSVEPMPPGRRTFDSMFVYDPHQVPLGGVPLQNFRKLKEAGSPFLARADRWNRLLVEVAFLQEDLAHARRAALYTGRPDDELKPHQAAVEDTLAALDALQQTYGRSYDAGNEDDLTAKFDPEAAKLEQQVHAARAALGQSISDLRPDLGAADWLSIPEARTDLPWWDAEAGRPRYIFWNRWSGSDFRELEEPLNLGDGQTLTVGTPRGMTDGVCDWSNYLDQTQMLQDAGARRFSLITHYSLHDKGYLSPEFVRQQTEDPELYMWDKEGKPAGAQSGLCQINWLNPAVREHMVDVLGQMAEFFKDRPEYQFYVTSWESAGPYASGIRVGSQPSHVAAFREYLRQRYGTIRELNARWGTDYAEFGDISPLPEDPPPVGDPASALYIESNRWAQEAYVDYVKLIRDTIRAVDPSKPVLGEHSGLLSRVISPRIYESVDILGHHRRARTTTAVQVWMASLQRYANKSTGLFENFWGCQEDHPRRMPEEKVMRAQLRRYLYRHAVWGRCTQTWWYAYTSAPYLLSYNGNWFNPVYDLTTLRYSAAGLPVEKEKVDHLQSLLLAGEIVPSRLLIVQPYATMLAQGPGCAAWNEWLDWHHLLFPRNLLYEALPDTWFAEGTCDLGDFDVAILPIATHLDRRFTEQLVAFAREGGTIIASGPCGMWDECGLPNSLLLQAAQPELAPVRESGPDEEWRYSYGLPANERGWVEVSVGKGKLVLLPSPVASREDEGAGLCEYIGEQVTPAAEAPGTSLELLLRRLPDGRHLLCAINRDPDEAAAGEVTVEGAFTRVADVDIVPPFAVPARIERGRTRFPMTLDAGATAYYLLAK